MKKEIALAIVAFVVLGHQGGFCNYPFSSLGGSGNIEFQIENADGISGSLDPQSQENLNRALRHEAKRFGRVSRLKDLVKQGAQVNAQAEFGETALYYAVMFGRTKAALYLLSAGANPNLSNDQGKTSIHKAAETRNFRVLRKMLILGGDVNAADFSGKTALIHAVSAGCSRSTALILKFGGAAIDFDHEDDAFLNAMDYARQSNTPDLETMVKQAQEKSRLSLSNNSPRLLD